MLVARKNGAGSSGYQARLVCAAAAGLALAGLLAGCSSLRKTIDRINREASSSGGLESVIQDELTTKFHRSVRSVSCTPYTDQVLPGDTAQLSCLVRFSNGTSYRAAATITDPSNDPDIAVNNYSFEDPPGADITTAPLSGPTVVLTATSPGSLFAAHNLAAAIKRLTARVGGHDLIIQLALYPGELEAVIGANGEARLVSVTYSGALKVGPQASFTGSRSGIVFSQLVPGVIQRLTKLVAARGGVPVARIDRFVLTNSLPHGDSGWNIYPTSGSTRFQSLVLGDHLVMITPGGNRVLR
jgi:hypothetical protein